MGLKKAGAFGRAALRQIMAGCPVVTPEVKEERMTICRGCPHFVPERDRCAACGCNLDMKTSWKTSHCPHKFW